MQSAVQTRPLVSRVSAGRRKRKSTCLWYCSIIVAYAIVYTMRNYTSEMLSATLILHVTQLAAYGFTLYCSTTMLNFPHFKRPGQIGDFDPGQLKFLTIWNVIIQAIFFLLCTVNDLYGTNKVAPKKAPLIRKIKDYFHATYGFPLAMFVGITFWALMFVDRELVLPKALDPYFPWWLNHLMHTLIMVSTMLEMIIAPRRYPKRSYGFTGLITLMLVYLVWIHVIYMKSGIWVYPVMDVLSLPLRILFFLGLFAFSSLLYFAGEALDHLLWGTAKRPSGKATKKKKSK